MISGRVADGAGRRGAGAQQLQPHRRSTVVMFENVGFGLGWLAASQLRGFVGL
jgi:hypothetical protein